MKFVNSKKSIKLILFILILVFSYNFFVYFDLKNNWYFLYKNKDFDNIVTCFSIWNGITKTNIASFFVLLLPIFLVYIACYNIFTVKNSGFINYISIRYSKRKYIIKNLLWSWKNYATILPVICLTIFLISCILNSNTSLPNDQISNGIEFLTVPNMMYKTGPIIYILLNILSIFLLGIFTINIGFIVNKYVNNFYLMIVGSYILFIVIETVGVSIIGPAMGNALNNGSVVTYFSTYNLWYLDALPSPLIAIFYGIVLIVLSTIIILIIYSDRGVLINENV